MSHEYWARGVMTAGLPHARAMHERITEAREDLARDIADARKALGRLEEVDDEMRRSVEALDIEIAKETP